MSEAAIPYKKEPVLDVAEFLHVCVLPHMNIVPQDDSPSNAVSCNLALALLRVAMETPTLQLCDWAAVVRCHLFPTILCVCSLADVCGSLHEDYAHENLYSVKEMALDVLDLLTRILSRQQSPRMGMYITYTMYISKNYIFSCHIPTFHVKIMLYMGRLRLLLLNYLQHNIFIHSYAQLT